MWTDRTDAIAWSCADWKTSVEQCSRKKKSSGSCRDRKWVNFSLNILGRVGGQKITGRTWTHRTETDIRTKSPPTFSHPPYVAIRAYYTWASLSSSLLTLHRNLPLGRIQHNTRRQCLSLCFTLSITRDGRVCLSEYNTTVLVSVSTSTLHKMAVLASVSYTEHHRRCQCLPLWVT